MSTNPGTNFISNYSRYPQIISSINPKILRQSPPMISYNSKHSRVRTPDWTVSCKLFNVELWWPAYRRDSKIVPRYPIVLHDTADVTHRLFAFDTSGSSLGFLLTQIEGKHCGNSMVVVVWILRANVQWFGFDSLEQIWVVAVDKWFMYWIRKAEDIYIVSYYLQIYIQCFLFSTEYCLVRCTFILFLQLIYYNHFLLRFSVGIS